ncbi:MAG: TatD family hydrolase [Erysipelotrichaceae bacterium]
MSFWIDSHCHLNDDRYKEDFELYHTNAQKAKVFLSNLICLNQTDYLRSKQIKGQYHDNYDISFGYFPSDCESITQTDLDALYNLVKQDREIIAIGEIGLDYHYPDTNREKQQDLFVKQIEMANQLNKPIIIHSRDASLDSYELLKAHAKGKVVLHCYSQSVEMMMKYLDLGYYISFSGVVTFSSAKTTKQCAQICPLDRLLIETDAPYLTPVPFRGKQNETAYVSYVGEYIAQLKGLEIETLQKQIYDNYCRMKEC